MNHSSNALRPGIAALAAGFFLFLAAGATAGDGATDFIVVPDATYVISQRGSYRLSADVTMASDITAIQVLADIVTIDLNGHVLRGADAGSSTGIEVQAAGCVITNGTVERFGGTGISSYGNIRVEKVLVQFNGLSGMTLGENAEVLNCQVFNNLARASTDGDAGILVVQMCRIIGCQVRGNSPPSNSAEAITAQGIRATARTIIEDCVATEQIGVGGGDGVGISTGAGCIIRGNLCTNNAPGFAGGTGYGITASSAAVIENNICTGNGGTDAGSNGTGISVGSNCTLRNNQVTAPFSGPNGLALAIFATTDCRIDANKIEIFNIQPGASGIGIRVSGTGNLITANMIAGAATHAIHLINVTGSNRAESNRMTGSGGITQVTAGTLSAPIAGDPRENLAY